MFKYITFLIDDYLRVRLANLWWEFNVRLICLWKYTVLAVIGTSKLIVACVPFLLPWIYFNSSMQK